MQEIREESLVRPPADQELEHPHQRFNIYNHLESTTIGGVRLMDVILSVLERIKEDNIPLVLEERRMLNYEPVRRERDLRTGDERGSGGGGKYQTGASWMMSLAEEEEEKFVERIAKKVEERIAKFLDNKIQKLLEEVLMPLLGQKSIEPKITPTVQPPPYEDKFDANHSGVKRKAVSLLENVVHDESTSTGVPNKKTLNEDWTCALCQVTATSKLGLDDHFKGKKHKLNEAATKSKNERKNFENRLSLKNKAACDASYLCEAKQTSVSPPEHVANEFTSTGVASVVSEDLSCAICQFSTTNKLAFDAHLQGTKHKSKEADLRIVAKNQDNGLLRKEEANQSENGNSTNKTIEADKKSSKHGKKKSMIWCDICCVGVTSEVAMELHKKGKNHLKLLKDVSIQNTVESCVNVDADAAEVVVVEVKDKDDSTFENVDDMECGECAIH